MPRTAPPHQGCPSPAAPLPQALLAVVGPPHGSAAPPQGRDGWVDRCLRGPLAGTGAPPGLQCPGAQGLSPGWGWQGGQLQGVGGRMWKEQGAWAWGRGAGKGVFLTWTCCFAGFPPRGPWPETSSACARGSGLAAGGQMRPSLSQGLAVAERWPRHPGESRVSRGRGRSGPHLAVAGGPQSGCSAGTSDASSSVWG